MPKLSKSDLERSCPEVSRLEEDEQINVNHINCPAGRDSKKRLFIRNKEGLWLYKCHHCGVGGAVATGPRRYIRDRVATQTTWNLQLPPDLNTCPMNLAGVAWLNKYGITGVEQQAYGIGWSTRVGRVILPIVNQRGELLAYQSRRVLPQDTLPKYLTDKRKDIRFPMFLGTRFIKGNTVVLTEDILSAIVIARQCPSVALLGTGLSTENRNDLIAEGFTRFVLWLDDDNPAVRMAQRKVARSIEPFADVTMITGHTVDPKEMTDEEIKQWLSI